MPPEVPRIDGPALIAEHNRRKLKERQAEHDRRVALGARLQTIRLACKRTQEEIHWYGIVQPLLSGMENGFRPVTPERVAILARAYELTPEEIIDVPLETVLQKIRDRPFKVFQRPVMRAGD